MVETVATCLILTIIMLGCFETFSVINSKMKVQRIAREGAREAAINDNNGGIENGKSKARDIANQYLPGTSPSIHVYINKANGQDANVVCDVSLDYKFVRFLRQDGIGGKKINATAIYPWEDKT